MRNGVKAVVVLSGLGFPIAPSLVAQDCGPAAFFGSPEHSIFGEGEVERLRGCLSAGLDWRTMHDPDGRSILHAAARMAVDEGSIRLLVAAGIDPNARSTNGRTPLFEAAGWNRHAAVTDALLEIGADPESEDDLGRTPLFIAVWNENPVVVGPLVAARPFTGPWPRVWMSASCVRC